jgi:hypothetical protein
MMTLEETTPKLEDYECLIAKLAHSCLGKMPQGQTIMRQGRRPSERFVSVEDLMSEGAITFFETVPLYDPDRGAFSTILTQAVTNRFFSLLKSSWRDYNTFENLSRKSHRVPAPNNDWMDMELLKNLKLSEDGHRFVEAIMHPSTETMDEVNLRLDKRLQTPRSEGYAYLLGEVLGLNRDKVRRIIKSVKEQVQEVQENPTAKRFIKACWV